MHVSKWMATKVITVTKKTDIKEALQLMEKYSIRHLPVVEKGQFVGFVTESDLRPLLIPAMLEDIKVKDAMITEPVVVSPDTDIETAAKLIYQYKIGGLPVIEGEKVAGIITTTDILRAFIEIMGILMAGSRLDIAIGDAPDAFKEVCDIISNHHGRIISLGILPNEEETIYAFRLEKCDLKPIVKALSTSGYKVISTFP